MSRILSKVLNNIADKLGLKVIPQWRWNHYGLATHTKDLFDLIKIDCVFDVGANKGQYANFLRTHVGYEGLILSFEPVPDLYRQLNESSKKDPLWKAFPFAFGSSNGICRINITKGHTLNSFLKPKKSGLTFGDKFKVDDYNEIVRSEDVEVKTIDIFLEEMDLSFDLKKAKIFLKIDTQGFESYVLDGAKKSLSMIYALQSEVSCLPIYQDMVEYLTAIQNLKSLGFDVTEMIPVNRDQWLRVVEFDFIAINREKIKEIKLGQF